MADEVIAEVEIDGNKILHFTDIFLRQRFNEHHDFSIRVNHDALETFGSFTLDNSKNLIGKNATIRYVIVSGSGREVAQEFWGIVCEIAMEQSNNSAGDLIIKGFSPTILLEDGPHLASFSWDNDKTLNDIVSSLLANANCPTHLAPRHTSPIKYVCQYKESTFHFINRLSSDYGENFYYDGQTLIFGDPAEMDFINVVYGEDLNNMQLSMHVEPLKVVKYGYNSMENQLHASPGSDTALSNLDEYAQHVVDVSNTLYATPDALPVIKTVDTEEEVKKFVDKGKEAIAAALVVLSGTTNNPRVFLGCVADVKISRRNGSSFTTDDFGVYLVTDIIHHITGQGRYYNTFKALSGWVRGIPVYNAARPLAEPQFGTVVANRDPSHLHRARVKLDWQIDPEKTPWIWIMTPDAGPGKDGAGGGGFVFNPQVNDRVLVGFEHNNPDMPFVMGSIFHGRSGRVEDRRCITGRTTSAHVCIDDTDGSIWIVDDHSNNVILKNDGIWVQADKKINLHVFGHESTIDLSNDDITISGKNITIHASQRVTITGDVSAIMKKDESTYFKAESSQATMQATTALINATTADVQGATEAKLHGGQVKINGTATTEIKGGTVQLNP